MLKSLTLILLTLFTINTNAQSIYSSLHLNDENYFKTKKPKNITKTSMYNGITTTSVQGFDDAGMLLTEQRFDENNNLTARLIYVNDTTKHIILSIQLEQRGVTIHSISTSYFKYDTNDFLVGIEEKKNERTVRNTTIKNNDKGNPVELSVQEANGATNGKEYAIYNYSKNQAIISVANYYGKIISNDTITVSFKNAFKFKNADETYNDEGDPVTYNNKNPDGTYSKYFDEYKYDIYGNCIAENVYLITTNKHGKTRRSLERSYTWKYLY